MTDRRSQNLEAQREVVTRELERVGAERDEARKQGALAWREVVKVENARQVLVFDLQYAEAERDRAVAEAVVYREALAQMLELYGTLPDPRLGGEECNWSDRCKPTGSGDWNNPSTHADTCDWAVSARLHDRARALLADPSPAVKARLERDAEMEKALRFYADPITHMTYLNYPDRKAKVTEDKGNIARRALSAQSEMEE